MKAAQTNHKNSEANWLELYFIRYFVGTVVGSAIILYLNSSKTSSLSGLILPGVTNVSNLTPQLLSVLLALGLAFCYIASAPILVLHASRGSFLSEDTKSFKKAFWITFAVVALLITSLHYCSNIGVNLTLALVLFSLILLLQIIPLTLSLKKEGDIAHRYYDRLTNARSVDSNSNREYVESYKHLREHGNAFFILLFESFLGLILLTLPKPNWAFISLIVWILPAALVWFIGTILEHRFSKRTVTNQAAS